MRLFMVTIVSPVKYYRLKRNSITIWICQDALNGEVKL